jgi:hyperosmotically inducible protein
MRRFVASLLLLPLFAGCTSAQQQQAQNTVNSVGTSAPQQLKDAYVVAAVKAKLIGVDADSSTAVGVGSDRGAVTLTGQARSDSERQAYDAAARSVQGVVSVVDRIAVNPHLRGVREQTGDAALAARVSAAIAGQAGVNVFHVNVSARRGIVTLEGTVPTPAIARTVVDTARGVSGVTNVISRITTQEPGKKT